MSASILVAYATHFGSTAETAEIICEALRARGYRVTCQAMAEVETVSGFDAAVLGSAVEHGGWLPAARTFVQMHRQALGEMPVALFSVHIQNTGDDPANRAKRHAYTDDIRALVSPVDEAFFAGRFSKDGAASLMPKFIARWMPSTNLHKPATIRTWAGSLKFEPF